MNNKTIGAVLLTAVMSLTMVGCGTAMVDSSDVVVETLASETTTMVATQQNETQVSDSEEVQVVAITTEGSVLDTSKMFTERDLTQTVDMEEAQSIQLVSGEDVLIENEGIYVLRGETTETTIIVDADDEAKVQLVLDGVSVTNTDTSVIYVKSADKVYVTTTDTENYMAVTGLYSPDGDTNLDAVIFSKDDLVLNGIGTLEIQSTKGNGITSKDDLKVTGGTYTITAWEDGLEGNDSIRIYDGTMVITANKDGLHSENGNDANPSYIYIQGGQLTITAGDDAIHATGIVQIDGGTINIPTSLEGIESTYIQINDGIIDIYASDDGINATSKSDYDVVIEVNGGTIHVEMGSGDTDAFDANGQIYLNGGTIDLICGSSFDADNGTQLGEADITVNGEVVTEIVESQQGMKGSRER